MTSTQKLYESYFAVYNDELRETLAEEVELFEDVDYLYDDELEEIVDEAIEAMIEEGFDIDEIEEAFEDLLSEATVTTGRGGYTKLSSDKRSAPVTTGQGTAMRQQARRAAVVSAARQRQAQAVKDAPGKAAARVKSAVQSGVAKARKAAARVKSAVQSGVAKARKAVDTAAGDYAAKHKLVSGKKGQALRRDIRAKVVGHLAQRAAGKLQRGVEKAKGAVKSAGQAAVAKTKSSSDAAQAKMQAAGSAAKQKGKSLVGRVARKVASGAGKLASRLGENVDVYDVVLEHLLAEGYAETPEAAQAIMVNMSEAWIDEILEG